MDEQQQEAFAHLGQKMSEIVVAFTASLAPLVEAIGKVAVAFAEAYTRAQDGYYYEKATGLPYDPARIVEGSRVQEILLLPERAESLARPGTWTSENLIRPQCTWELGQKTDNLTWLQPPDLFTAFRVPPSMLGDPSDTNYHWADRWRYRRYRH